MQTRGEALAFKWPAPQSWQARAPLLSSRHNELGWLGALQADGIQDWSGVAAVLCGQKGMCEAVTELLTGKGVPKESILLNF